MCHASFVAVLWDGADTPMSAIDLVRFGRLAHNVRKDGLLCSLDAQGQPCFITLHWSGFA